MSAVRGEVTADLVVVVLGGGRGTRLDPLTRLRSKPAVPLAGKFRLIDVAVSNALNSGMQRIFVLTQFNSVSLHRHLVASYRLGPFSRGFVEVLAAQQTPSDERWFQGTADAVRQNLGFISELRGTKVLILSGDHLYRMDYTLLLREHVRSGAEITMAVLPCSEEEIAGFGAVRVDPSGRVVEFREKPATAEARAGMELPQRLRPDPKRPYLASMGIYLFEQEVLTDCLESDADDFGKHVLPAAVGSRRVQAHLFEGYWRDIGTIRAFYEAHMDMVRPSPPFSFHDPACPIYTHPRFLPGSRMDGLTITRSVIADGAVLKDARIEDSVIGVRSRVRGATLRRVLLMGADEDAEAGIEEGSVIENAIIDKNARIGRNVRLVNRHGLQEAGGEGWLIRQGVIVVPKNAVVPDGSEI